MKGVIRLSKSTMEYLEKYRKKCIRNCTRYRDMNDKYSPLYEQWNMSIRDWESFSLSEIVARIVKNKLEEE